MSSQVGSGCVLLKFIVMKQPKSVIIKPSSEKTLYKLPDTPIECKIQEREIGDDSKIIYITNPRYIKD